MLSPPNSGPDSGPTRSLRTLLWRLWGNLSSRRRKQFGLLFVLMLMASLAEVISIGAVIPFLGVLASPERVFRVDAVREIARSLGLTSPEDLVLPMTIGFGAVALIAGCLRLLLLWANNWVSYAAGADLGFRMYERTLYQPYAIHCSRNSSEVINGIFNKSNSAISVIQAVLAVKTALLMVGSVLILLMAVDPISSLYAFGGFGLIYLGIVKVTKRRLILNSNRIAKESTQVIKSLQEGLGGIRDVLIDGSQSFYCKRFRDADLTLRRAQASNAFIGASPRYAIEALGLVLIAGLAYQLAGEAGGVTSAIPVLGALALGAQRLLPQLQQAYSAWSSIRGSQAALSDALVLLEQPLPSQLGGGRSLQLPFETGIRLKKLGFRYGESGQFVFRDIDLTIHKGSRVGFVGSTGCGKSTLLDVVMGLLEPTEGVIEIDERILTVKESPSWRARIAHVPQSIFLADASVTENIAFGVPSECIDAVRVAWAAEQAQISATIEAWPMRYKTHVGERGIRLSGGQRQRIGIARALYKQCDVIVFDEATSALDSETERAVMRSISALGKELTLLVIAHRVGTLSNCDRIVEVGEDGLIQVCTYAEFISDK